MITLRDDQPVNFAPAFLKSVTGEDFMNEAVNKLEAEAERIARDFGTPVFSAKLGEKPLCEILKDMESEIAGRI